MDIGKKKKEVSVPKDDVKSEEKKEDISKVIKKDGNDNYLLKSVRRLP